MPEEEIEVSERTAIMLLNDDREAFAEVERRVPPPTKSKEQKEN